MELAKLRRLSARRSLGHGALSGNPYSAVTEAGASARAQCRAGDCVPLAHTGGRRSAAAPRSRLLEQQIAALVGLASGAAGGIAQITHQLSGSVAWLFEARQPWLPPAVEEEEEEKEEEEEEEEERGHESNTHPLDRRPAAEVRAERFAMAALGGASLWARPSYASSESQRRWDPVLNALGLLGCD